MTTLTRTAVVTLLLWSGAWAEASATPREVWSDVPVPGAAGALALAAGLDPSIERSRLVLEIIGRMGDKENPGGRASLEELGKLAGSGAGSLQTAPLPLDPEVWSRAVLGRHVPAGSLLAAILGDRTASLVYQGLASLDDATLGFLADHPGTLARIHRGAPEAFAAFGRSLRVRGGRVVPPGPADAERLWEALVGESLQEPSRFMERVLVRDQGRLAFFYDALAHLSPPQQAFALGLALRDLEERMAEFRRLYRAFARSEDRWSHGGAPFTRPSVDVPRLLAGVSATPEGRWSGRLGRRRWSDIFGDAGVPSGGDGEISAAWLAEHVGLGRDALRSDRWAMVLFAQRVFPDLDETAGGDLTEALRAVPRFPALVLTLERMGIREPKVYAAAGRQARRLSSLPRGGQTFLACAQLQASLALLERARFRGTLDVRGAQDLLEGLLDLPLWENGGYRGGVAAWVDGRLRPALVSATGSERDDPLELVVAQALSGAPPVPPRALVRLGGVSYRFEPETAELLRLQGVRRRQGGPSLDEGVAFSHLLAGTPATDDLRKWAAKLPRLPPKGAAPAPALEELTRRCGVELERRALSPGGPPGGSPLWFRDLLLTDALVSFLYAASLGPVEGPTLVAGDVALRHDFGLGDEGPWQIPKPEVGPGRPWHVRGSLLALDAGLAGLGLRRLNDAPPSRPPSLPTIDAQAFALALALMNPGRLLDEDRDAIADALRRGREEVRKLAGQPGDADAVASRAGLDEWRHRALPWTLAHEPERVQGLFSLLELLRLGRPEGPPGRFDPWGAPAVPVGGCLCLRLPGPIQEDLGGRWVSGRFAAKVPDLNLRIAEALAERRLPAALAPGVLAPLLQDFLDEVDPAFPEDWVALTSRAGAIPEERMDAYIASLSEGGSLVALRAGETPGAP